MTHTTPPLGDCARRVPTATCARSRRFPCLLGLLHGHNMHNNNKVHAAHMHMHMLCTSCACTNTSTSMMCDLSVVMMHKPASVSHQVMPARLCKNRISTHSAPPLPLISSLLCRPDARQGPNHEPPSPHRMRSGGCRTRPHVRYS